MQDTAPAANQRYFELLRQVGPAKRMQMCASLSRSVRDLALAGIREEHHPKELSNGELRHYLACRLYGAAVAQRYFPLISNE
jgi:hypothetical protein